MAQHQPAHGRWLATQLRGRHRRPAAEHAEGVRHRRVEHLGLLAQLAGGLRDRPLGRRPDRPQRLDQVVTHACACEAAIGVGRVLAPLEAARAQVRPHLLPRHAQQRPHQPPPSRRHPIQGARARRNGEPVEHRLRLIGRRMRRRIVALCQALGERVASIASPFLEVARGVLSQSDPLGEERHPEPGAQLPNELLVARSPLPQPVVHVQRAHPCLQAHRDVQQRHRVPAARHQHEQRRSGGDQRTGRLEDAHGSRGTTRHSWRGSSNPFSFTCPMPSNTRCAPRTASVTESVTSTSPPRARATTREARLMSRPK